MEMSVHSKYHYLSSKKENSTRQQEITIIIILLKKYSRGSRNGEKTIRVFKTITKPANTEKTDRHTMPRSQRKRRDKTKMNDYS